MLILVFVLQVYINGVPRNWWCGSSFGYRRMLDLLPIFILGLAVFMEWVKEYLPVKVVYSVLVLLVIWNIGFMIQFVFGMISHTAPVSFQEVARNQFTQVPEKLMTILRYIFFRH